jgi:hypothetical protein
MIEYKHIGYRNLQTIMTVHFPKSLIKSQYTYTNRERTNLEERRILHQILETIYTYAR